ncbi:uncharacterized protein LOC126815047, partial [Patella vulgata]|uniref:uncharacterized protein LOC126815047 n=1 Tax=Patella vulgata TaxID=6465 RepID=UPI0024A918F1
STSSEISVTFISESLVLNSGFSLWYRGQEVCENQTFNLNHGVLASTKYSQNYANSEDCYYNINVDDASGGIVLKFSNNCSDQTSSFWIGANDIQYESDFYWTRGSKVTYADWFKGWPDGDGSKSQPSDDGLSNEDCVELRRSFRHSGKESELVDRLSSNVVYMRFTTDNSRTFRGFKLQVSAIKVKVDNRRIILTVVELDVEYQIDCLYDYFMINDSHQAIVVLTPQSSISDILMSEPIWIGLIVILSVLCFFGIFYLIRRKCGKYFKCCEPNKKKTPNKDNKKDKTDMNETTFSSDIYSVEKSLQKFTNIPPILITPYTPVSEPANEGRKIAKRFFASYNGAGTTPITTPVTTDFIQNTATFLSEPADDKNGEIVGGRLLLDHLQVKSTSSLPRKSTSLDPTAASVNRGARMKRSHSTGPYLVRQETQFDDYALDGSINNGYASSSTDHIYPNVIVAQNQKKADGDEAALKQLGKDESDRLCLSPNFLSVNRTKLHETRSVDRLECVEREERYRKDFLEGYHRISKSLDVPTSGFPNLEPRKIKIMEDNYQCSACTRSVSEHNYHHHHHHHRHQRHRHDDYQSRSFDDRLPGYHTNCDYCNHRQDPDRRRN